MEWKVAIIVDGASASAIMPTISQVQHAGWDEIDLFATSDCVLPICDDICVHRDSSLHTWGDAFESAVDTFATVYARRVDLILLIRAGCRVWKGLRDYCESTIQPQEMKVWSPFTPQRVSSAADSIVDRPNVSGFQWSEHQVNGSLSTVDCLVVPGMVAELLAYRLLSQSDARQETLDAIEATVGREFASSTGVRWSFHVPSLVQYVSDTRRANDFVGAAYKLPGFDRRRNI